MSVQYNSIRRSEKDQPGGVAGLDAEGLLNVQGVIYQDDLGEPGFPPVIAEGGTIEAIVEHRQIDASDDPATVPLDGEIAILQTSGGKLLTIGDGTTPNGLPVAMKMFQGSIIEITENKAATIELPGLGNFYRELLIIVAGEEDAVVEVDIENGETLFLAHDTSDGTVTFFGEGPLTVTGEKIVFFKPVLPFVSPIDAEQPIVIAPTIDRSGQEGKAPTDASLFVTQIYAPIAT